MLRIAERRLSALSWRQTPAGSSLFSRNPVPAAVDSSTADDPLLRFAFQSPLLGVARGITCGNLEGSAFKNQHFGCCSEYSRTAVACLSSMTNKDSDRPTGTLLQYFKEGNIILHEE